MNAIPEPKVIYEHVSPLAVNPLRILVVATDLWGMGYHRLINPYGMLSYKYGEKYHVKIVLRDVGNELEWAQLVVIQRCNKLSTAILHGCNVYGIPVIFDQDDGEWLVSEYLKIMSNSHVECSTKEIYHNWLSPELQFVTVPSEHLGQVMQHDNPSLEYHVFPNSLLLQDTQWCLAHDGDPNNRIRIGMVGGWSHNRDARILTNVTNKFPNVNWVLAGGKETTEPWVEISSFYYYGVKKERQIRIPWLPINRYGIVYSGLDIGVVPCLSGEFERCKSALKIAEYGAYGVPALFSDSCDYRTHLEPAGLSELLIPNYKDVWETKREWTRKIGWLIDDDNARKELGTKLRKLTEEQFCLETNVDKLATIVDKAAGRKRIITDPESVGELVGV